MYGQTSFDGSKTPAANKGLVSICLGLIVFYQIVNHVFLNDARSHQDDDPESDASCTTLAGPKGYSCMEAKLFQGWHELPTESAEDLEQLLAVTPSSDVSTSPEAWTLAEASAPATEASVDTQGHHGNIEAGGDILLPETPHAVKHQDIATVAQTDVGPDALNSLLWDLAFSVGGGDKSDAAAQHARHEKNRKPSWQKSKEEREAKAQQEAKKSKSKAKFMAKQNKKQRKKHVTTSEELASMQKTLETKMHKRAKRKAEHQALRALSAAAHGHSSEVEATHDGTTPTLIRQLERETERAERAQILSDMGDFLNSASAHASTFAAATKHKATKYDSMTPLAHSLEDMQHGFEDYMAIHNKRAERTAAREKQKHHAVQLLHGEGQTAFMNKVDAVGRQICQDPARRATPACARFLHPDVPGSSNFEETSKLTTSMLLDPNASAMAHIELVEKHLEELKADREHHMTMSMAMKRIEADREHENEEMNKESVDFLRELCTDPTRHSHLACARVLETTAAPSTRLRASKAFLTPASVLVEQKSADEPAVYSRILNWAPRRSSDAYMRPDADTSAAAPLVMQRQPLRDAHWEGKAPSVACVAVLPEGQVTEALMTYFINNYKLQHYEGARELVLVYSRADKEASRIANLYADGTTIKAGAAEGGDRFPSATAFRFGAWLASNADLVVRWDFEAWHHPNRISMQVRALTLSQRPASLVPLVTFFKLDSTKAAGPGGAGPHGSMMGDAAWMRKHWMPLHEEEHTVMHGLRSSDIVQIAMPELLAYHESEAQPRPLAYA